MPFQSEKQRRFLHANHPEIAKRWERDYANGGILDINASEEIISDDGNDIELTAYNAAFDDPNDLSTGVRTLFMKKGGQAIGGGIIHGEPRGDRTGFWDPGGKSPGTSSTGGQRESGRERGIREAATKSKPTSFTTGDASLAEQIAADDRKRRQELKDLIARGDIEKYDTEAQMLQDKFTADQPGDIRRGDYEINRENEAYEQALTAQKAKFKKMGWTRLLKAAALFIIGVPPKNILKSVMITKDDMQKVIEHSIPVMKAKYGLQKTLEKYKGIYEKYGMPEFNPHVDTKLQDINQQILDLTQRPDKDEDDKGGPELPQVVPIGEEIEEYEGTYAMSPWERIKANQAKRAMLVEKGIIQDSPIVGESVTDITMEANSGGLANLFRVKNQ